MGLKQRASVGGFINHGAFEEKAFTRMPAVLVVLIVVEFYLLCFSE